MADVKFLNPDTLGKPLGQYSHLTRVKASEFIFIAGQVGVDSNGKLVGDGDFDAQCVQTFANIEAALKSVGAGWGNIVQFTTYMGDGRDTANAALFLASDEARFITGTEIVVDGGMTVRCD